MQSSIGNVGSIVHERFDPSSLLRDPPKPEDVTLELLMSSQTHMGHHTSLWNPANQRYIYGARAGIHIISLEETAAALRRAARVVEEVAYLGGLMLFVGNRKGQMEVTARSAEMAGACHLFSRWVPGTITNRDQILGGGGMRVVDEKDQTLPGFEGHLTERRPLMPELVVVLNPLENYTMLQECAQENIPTIGLIDTDADPTQVTYVIPGNDDRCVFLSTILPQRRTRPHLANHPHPRQSSIRERHRRRAGTSRRARPGAPQGGRREGNLHVEEPVRCPEVDGRREGQGGQGEAGGAGAAWGGRGGQPFDLVRRERGEIRLL